VAIPPIKPVYGIQGFTGQLVLPPGPQPPSPPIEGSMYASGGFVYIWHEGDWVEIGADGGGATTQYVHNQPTLAVTWTVTHNLGKHPAVFIEDQGGSAMYGTIQYLNNNTLTVTFFRSATGRVNCT
jgi:hypothetical protein